MTIYLLALAVALVVAGIVALRGRPAGAAAAAVLGVLIIVPYLGTGLSPTQLRVPAVAGFEGVLAVVLGYLGRRSRTGSPIGLAVRGVAGLTAFGLAALAAFVGLLLAGGPFT